MKRDLPQSLQIEINETMKQSVEFALENPSFSLPYVKLHAINMDPMVMQQHIHLYVNNETVKIDKQGKEAVKKLCRIIRPDLSESLPLFISDL